MSSHSYLSRYPPPSMSPSINLISILNYMTRVCLLVKRDFCINSKPNCVCFWVTEGVWMVSMTTSDFRDAWTEGAEVGVVLCGDKRDSSVQPLITDNKLSLRRGCTAKFTVLALSQVLLIYPTCIPQTSILT